MKLTHLLALVAFAAPAFAGQAAPTAQEAAPVAAAPVAEEATAEVKA